MRNVLTIGAGVAAVALLAGVLVAEDGPAKVEPKGVAGMGWLAGDWTSGDENGSFDEHWLAPRGDAMFAVSRFVAGGTTKLCELSSIEEAADGTFLHVRHFSRALAPSKSEADGPISMKLIEQGTQSAAFEDAARGFPRRIVYRREGDVLTARLEGERGGKPAEEEFRLKLSGAR